MSTDLKYVRHSKLGFVLWQRTDDLYHKHMGQMLIGQAGGEILSAGFASVAGSRPGDIVLDPFMGSGTTAAVAVQHGRRYLGCELNAAYLPLIAQRLAA